PLPHPPLFPYTTLFRSIADYKQLETTLTDPPGEPAPALQQLRWPPTNIAGTAAEAMSRLFMLPGAHYKDPEFSWRYAVAPAGLRSEEHTSELQSPYDLV